MSDTPLIDKRSGNDIVEQATKLARTYAPEWKPGEGDRGLALAHLFARMMEIVIQRLNRVPEKHFLAFLDTAGIAPLPPKAAIAPVRFVLAAGAKGDGMVPKGTQIATAPVGGGGPITFEMEKNLVVQRPKLINLCTLDPAGDQYADLQAVLDSGAKNETRDFQPFAGTDQIPHRLYLAQDTLFKIDHPTRITLTLTCPSLNDAEKDLFTKGIIWKTLSSGQEKIITAHVNHVNVEASLSSDAKTIITITLPNPTYAGEILAKIDRKPVNGVERYWIWAETAYPLSENAATMQINSVSIRTDAADIEPAMAFNNAIPCDTHNDFYPFGRKPQRYDAFFIAADEALTRQPSKILLTTDFQAGKTVNGVMLQWEFWDGMTWNVLGATSHHGITTEQGVYSFLDYTKAFTEYGLVLNDNAAQSKPTLRVVALKDGVTINIAYDTADTFKITIFLTEAKVEEFTELTVETVEGEVNGTSQYIKLMNLGSISSAPGNRPVNVTHSSIPYPRVEFNCPNIVLTEVNGKKNHWLRVRIMNGDYGLDAQMTPNKKTMPTTPTLADWDYVAPSYEPPIIKKLSFAYAYDEQHAQETSACTAYNNFEFSPVECGESFTPFSKHEGGKPSFYLGFDSPFTASPVSLFLCVGESIVDPQRTVVWEYLSSNGWKNLGTTDGTVNIAQSGIVEFIGHSTAPRKELFGTGRPAYWIRARLKEGNKESAWLTAVHLNTGWARQCTTIADELIGSSTESPNAEFKLSRTPVLEGLQIEVREPEQPGGEELAKLQEEEGENVVRPAAKEGEASREQWVRWHRVDHFRFSDKKSRHYTLDWSNGIIRFGDGEYGTVPPAGRNNILARWYQAGGGSKGNAACGAISVLKRAVPFVDKAFNVDAAGGGSEGDSLEQMKIRGPQAIKHQDRAVTTEDYAWLAKEASLQVARARCLPARYSTNAGTVTLMIVPKSEEAQPMPSEGLKRQVREYINSSSRRIPTARLTIQSPLYDPVSITATVVPESMERADEIRRSVQERLQAFLHPLTGGPENSGWEFGRGVYVSEICKVIEDTEGVHHAEKVTLRSDGHMQEDDYLIASGEHIIEIKSLEEVSIAV